MDIKETNISFRIDKDIYDKIKTLAMKADRSLAKHVLHLIKKDIKKSK